MRDPPFTVENIEVQRGCPWSYSKEGAELGAESSEFGLQWLGSSGRPQVPRMGEIHMERENKQYSICKAVWGPYNGRVGALFT